MKIDIETGGLLAHGAKVRRMADRAAQAEQAAQAVSFQPQTYGLIGAALVYPLIAPLEAAGVGATVAATASLHATSTGIEEAVKDIEIVDAAVNSVMDKIRELI